MILELTEKEAHDLYDMLYMVEAGTIKVNGCQESYNNIFDKLEKYAVPELHGSLSTKEALNSPEPMTSKQDKNEDLPLDTHSQIKKEIDKDYTQEQKDNLCVCGHFSWNHYDLIGKCRKKKCSCNQFVFDEVSEHEK